MDDMTIDNINVQWKQIFHALKKASKPILNELGLTKVDANILLALNEKKQKTKAELAEHLSFEPSSLTRSLDRLIELNLIRRATDEKDRRFIRISLTNKGKNITNQYIKFMRNIWFKALKDIDKNEIAILKITLKKIFFNLYKG